MGKRFHVERAIIAPAERGSDGMPFGLFRGVRTCLIRERDGVSTYSMSEAFSGALAGSITKAIPDMTDSFARFADGLKRAAEAE